MCEGFVETLTRKLVSRFIGHSFTQKYHSQISKIDWHRHSWLAKDSDWAVYRGAADALLTLSDHGKMANMFVPALLMKIIVEYLWLAWPFLGLPSYSRAAAGCVGWVQRLCRNSRNNVRQVNVSCLLFSHAIIAEFRPSIGRHSCDC